MRCRVCDNEIQKRSEDRHCREGSPVDTSVCLGCWMATVELELFFVRARPERVVMGDWASGWLRAMLEKPKAYL